MKMTSVLQMGRADSRGDESITDFFWSTAGSMLCFSKFSFSEKERKEAPEFHLIPDNDGKLSVPDETACKSKQWLF